LGHASPAKVSRPARTADLPHLLGFIDEQCRRLEVDADTAHALRLAVEEVCMNLIDHGYRGMEPGPIDIVFRSEGPRLEVAISDRGHAFPPDRAPVPDLTLGWEDRPIGGLGWHLVKALTEHLEYWSDPVDGNRLTLVVTRSGGRRDRRVRAGGHDPRE
jgi:anti-sigma regulatory factor (Ser/Thr protein kinase)